MNHYCTCTRVVHIIIQYGNKVLVRTSTIRTCCCWYILLVLIIITAGTTNSVSTAWYHTTTCMYVCMYVGMVTYQYHHTVLLESYESLTSPTFSHENHECRHQPSAAKILTYFFRIKGRVHLKIRLEKSIISLRD
jgi:hypothetical protein